MFSIFYGLFSLFGKIGWNIEYGIDKTTSRNKAIQEGRDTYWDKTGKQRLVKNNQPVTTYRNMSGEVMRLDLHGNVVSYVRKNNEEHYTKETVKRWIADKYGNPKYWDHTVPCHKNFHWQQNLYKDLRTNKCVVIAELSLDKVSAYDKNYYGSRRHLFYLDPVTLKLIRETDGEVELRNRGYKRIASYEEVNRFIKEYNEKIDNEYDPHFYDKECSFDLSLDVINKMIWEQNRKENSYE